METNVIRYNHNFLLVQCFEFLRMYYLIVPSKEVWYAGTTNYIINTVSYKTVPCAVVMASNNKKELKDRLEELRSPVQYLPWSKGVHFLYECENWIIIGPNGTKVPVDFISKINWNNGRIATIALLNEVFDRETLATRTLFGDPPLDVLKVEDIVEIVTKSCSLSKEQVHEIIRFRCKTERRRFVC